MSYAFDMFLVNFKQSAMWKQMQQTVENSPWHREANVSVHTEMVIEQYRTRFAPFRSDLQNTIALTALLFHDVGKPEAEEEVQKKDGSGVYRRYAGHEQGSSVAFMEEYVRNSALRAFLAPEHARMVRWIIEHHLPYGLKAEDKVTGLRTAMKHTLGKLEETFYDCLRSDAAGRISDDHAEKLANVETWIKEFKAVQPAEPAEISSGPSGAPRCMFIMIGPSGSGKSTYTAQNFKPGDVVLSLDAMRLEFLVQKGKARADYANAAEAYAHAYEVVTKDASGFTAFVNARSKQLMEAVKAAGGNVFVDNVNASRKSRAQWVQLGRAHGMKIIAVEFWNTLKTVAQRQKTRGDKEVPYNAVKQQQFATTCAWLGAECDDVMLIVGE